MTGKKKKHPMQPVVIANDGCARFKENKIVSDLLAIASSNGMDLNQIAARNYSKDDYSQLMQLIGYSVSGYGDLSRSRLKHVVKADRIASQMVEELRVKAEMAEAKN